MSTTRKAVSGFLFLVAGIIATVIFYLLVPSDWSWRTLFGSIIMSSSLLVWYVWFMSKPLPPKPERVIPPEEEELQILVAEAIAEEMGNPVTEAYLKHALRVVPRLVALGESMVPEGDELTEKPLTPAMLSHLEGLRNTQKMLWEKYHQEVKDGYLQIPKDTWAQYRTVTTELERAEKVATRWRKENA